MTKVVTAFPSDRGKVFVELETDEPRAPVRVGRGGRDVLDSANQQFEEAVAGLRPIADTLLEQTTGLERVPKRVEIRFGIKLSAEVGVILASSTGEAHVEVKLTWERDG